jgi:NAD(P)-dependent dehydrogenase (short-subunit alcohol dehydrogenase family)
MSGRLEGKVAIVTGATVGIGEAVSRAFVREGTRTVLLVARTRGALERLAGELGPAALAHAGDVGDQATARAVVTRAGEHGGLDILVNNAGLDLVSPVMETSETEARRIFDVNLFGALFLLQEAARALAARGGGSIVNISSRTATAGVPGMAVYGASKGALEALSRAAAVELAPHQVRVNVVAPGLTRTRMNEEWVGAQDDPGAFMRRLEARIPQGRLARPEDVAAAVVYLASDEARHVTGATLAVDGGYTAA